MGKKLSIQKTGGVRSQSRTVVYELSKMSIHVWASWSDVLLNWLGFVLSYQIFITVYRLTFQNLLMHFFFLFNLPKRNEFVSRTLHHVQHNDNPSLGYFLTVSGIFAWLLKERSLVINRSDSCKQTNMSCKQVTVIAGEDSISNRYSHPAVVLSCY